MKSRILEDSCRRLIAYFLAVLYVICGPLGVAQAECIGGIGTDDIVISNKAADYYIYGDVVDCESIGSITLGPYVTIPDGATFNLTAPQVTVSDNVEVLSGGVLAMGPYAPFPPPDGCVVSPTVFCMGPTPGWPDFHQNVNHHLKPATTHVWSFVYESSISGQIGAVLSIGSKNLKISGIAGDTKASDLDCWRDFGGYIYYEHATGDDKYSCNLVVGQRYYFNIKNLDSATTMYQLKGFSS